MANKTKTLLLVILFFALFIRLYNINYYGLWMDEEATVMEAHGIYQKTHLDFNDVRKSAELKNVFVANAKTDSGNAILHVSLLHYWFKLVPVNGFTLRFISLLFGVALVLVVYRFSLLLFKDDKIALMCAFFTALHPALILYSQEGRSYMMAVLFSLLSSYYYYKIVFEKDLKIQNMFLYALCCTVAFLSHYLMAYIFMVQGAMALFLRLNKKQYLYLLFAALFVGSSFFLWLNSGGYDGLEFMQSVNDDYAKKTALDPNNPFYGRVSLTSITQGWTQVVLYISGNLLQNLNIQLRFLLPFLALPFLIVGVIFFKKNTKEKKREILFFVGLFLMGPIFATLLALKAGHNISFQPNYSLFSTTSFILCLGYFASQMQQANNKKLYLIPLFLTGSLFIVSLFAEHGHPGQKKKEEYCAITNQVRKDCLEKNEIQKLVFKAPSDLIFLNLYLDKERCAMRQEINSSMPERGIIYYTNNTQKEFK